MPPSVDQSDLRMCMLSHHAYHHWDINKWTATIYSGSIDYKNANYNYVSKSNPIVHWFLITFSDHLRKNTITRTKSAGLQYFFITPGFSFHYKPMLISLRTKSIVTDNSLKEKWMKEKVPFLGFLIRFYDFSSLFLKAIFKFRKYTKIFKLNWVC